MCVFLCLILLDYDRRGHLTRVCFYRFNIFFLIFLLGRILSIWFFTMLPSWSAGDFHVPFHVRKVKKHVFDVNRYQFHIVLIPGRLHVICFLDFIRTSILKSLFMCASTFIFVRHPRLFEFLLYIVFFESQEVSSVPLSLCETSKDIGDSF